MQPTPVFVGLRACIPALDRLCASLSLPFSSIHFAILMIYRHIVSEDVVAKLGNGQLA